MNRIPESERRRSPGRRPARPLLYMLLSVLTGMAFLAPGRTLAAPAWPTRTGGQQMLKEYVANADVFLTIQGETAVNSIFDASDRIVVFGITDQPNAEIPEGVEITARLFPDTLNSLELRVSTIPRFPQIAAAFIRALTPESMTMEEALRTPTDRAKKAMDAPANSWEETVEPMNGTMPYIYYAYYPNQYHDGNSWIQMTVIFPMAGTWDGSTILSGEYSTPAPENYGENPEDFEGYQATDDYTHYEFFTTPTPEPGAGDLFPFEGG